ncbi:Pde1b, partial [Symbiodinium sp. KB8]
LDTPIQQKLDNICKDTRGLVLLVTLLPTRMPEALACTNTCYGPHGVALRTGHLSEFMDTNIGQCSKRGQRRVAKGQLDRPQLAPMKRGRTATLCKYREVVKDVA